MKKLNNSNCDKTQKLKLWQNSETQIVIELNNQKNLANSFLVITTQHLYYQWHFLEAAFCNLAMFLIKEDTNLTKWWSFLVKGLLYMGLVSIPNLKLKEYGFQYRTCSLIKMLIMEKCHKISYFVCKGFLYAKTRHI